MGDPRVLNRVSLATGQSLDGCDLAGANVGSRHRAGTQRLTVEKNGASTALSHATTEFRACQVKIVTQDPKQGRVRQHVDGVRFPVDLDLKYRHREFSFQCLCPSLQYQYSWPNRSSNLAEACTLSGNRLVRRKNRRTPRSQAPHLADAPALSSISTMAVMPAERTMSGGTSSMWIRTGMRWASRTQGKIGFTVATPCLLRWGLETLLPRASLS